VCQDFNASELEPIEVKGKSKPLKVYSVIGSKR
jgi:class 3 adenylate cyclase